MPKHAIDITGQRYGSLTVIGRADKPSNNTRGEAYWLCRCDCGKELVAASTTVRNHGDHCTCNRSGRQRREEAQAERKRKAEERRVAIMRRTGCKKNEYAAMRALTGNTKQCPICGKNFELLSSQWVYKTTKKSGTKQKTRYYCSWTCYRKAD